MSFFRLSSFFFFFFCEGSKKQQGNLNVSDMVLKEVINSAIYYLRKHGSGNWDSAENGAAAEMLWSKLLEIHTLWRLEGLWLYMKFQILPRSMYKHIHFPSSSIWSYYVGCYLIKRDLIQQHTYFKILECSILSLNKNKFWGLFVSQNLIFLPFRTFYHLFSSENLNFY